jgi:hypothetical protein
MSVSKKYITLREAAKISGYAPDYVGQLIRKGKIPGKQVYANVAWVTTEEAVRDYLKKDAAPETSQPLKDGVVEHFRRGKVAVFSAFGRPLVFFRVALYLIIFFSVIFSILLFYVFSVNLEKYIDDRNLKRAVETKMIEPTDIPAPTSL